MLPRVARGYTRTVWCCLLVALIGLRSYRDSRCYVRADAMLTEVIGEGRCSFLRSFVAQYEHKPHVKDLRRQSRKCSQITGGLMAPAQRIAAPSAASTNPVPGRESPSAQTVTRGGESS